jgi:hypothetical protein
MVTITGSNYSPSAQVNILWNDPYAYALSKTLATVTTTSSGTFTVVVQVPYCRSTTSDCGLDADDLHTQWHTFILFPEP